ncbi:acyl-CoA thioester hydrolase/BAAT C-terminal domain-containing protein [Promicromonospora sp. NPDC059942]|uniref:acyl-CoA thioester hydrolase/BAAT C-terminal domain-containing protein n=1 Tax=Promicromonospora sp. NPDC059942 TaxID=3347009 RepID=UPI0036607684
MNETRLVDPEGVRFTPDRPNGVGVLVLAGSSGRIDAGRARLLAGRGASCESVRWFGGPGQNPGPWEIPLETFLVRIDSLATDCDRIIVVGTSFGAEAALLLGAVHPRVDGVAAFAPTDVVWAGIAPNGRQTSHWTMAGTPLPYVPFDRSWTPETDPPEFRGLYTASREAHPDEVAAAAIPFEQVRELLVVAGGDDRVWDSVDHAHRIAARRDQAGLATTVVEDPLAGHRAVLPGEAAPTGGQRMARGGSTSADAQLGTRAWTELIRLLDR